MSSWSDSINFNSCLWFNNYNNNNARSTILAGLLFFIGWWLIIDANVAYSNDVGIGYYIWGTLGTISLIMVNSISRQELDGDYFTGGLGFGVNSSRACLFVGFVLGFASVIASFCIYFKDFQSKIGDKTPGIELVLQNILIFLSSITLKFFRNDDNNIRL